MSKILLRVSVHNGKYTVKQKEGSGLYALRYGELWRDLTGDGLIHALASEIESLRAEVARLEKELK